VHHITPLHIEALVSRWKTKYARNTCFGRTYALRRVLHFYEQTTDTRGLVHSVPRVPSPRPRGVTAQQNELDALHRYADPLMRLWLRITVAFALGQADVQKLSPANYHAENKTVSFERTKTREPQTLPVPPDLAELFENCPEDTDPQVPYLVRFNNGHRLSPSAIRKRWHTLKQRAGVRSELNPHDLRRTTATALYELTHDIRAVQQLLGHQSLRPTAAYLADKHPDTLRPLLAQLWKPVTEVKQ
jgi:integrase/recombinase XerC